MVKKKKNKKADLKKQINIFDKIPNSCLVCGKTFDKKNKEMVMKWRVEVFNDPPSVKLFCPDCWDYADSTKDYLSKQNTNVKNKDAEDKETSDGYGTWNYNLEKMRKK